MLFAKIVGGYIESFSESPFDVSEARLQELADLDYHQVPSNTDRVDALRRQVIGDPMDGNFGDKQASRVITRGQFQDRFSIPTQLALEQIAEGQDQAGRVVRVFTRRLEAEATVNLDSPFLDVDDPQSPLSLIAGILAAAEVPGWATEEDAEASIAAILA